MDKSVPPNPSSLSFNPYSRDAQLPNLGTTHLYLTYQGLLDQWQVHSHLAKKDPLSIPIGAQAYSQAWCLTIFQILNEAFCFMRRPCYYHNYHYYFRYYHSRCYLYYYHHYFFFLLLLQISGQRSSPKAYSSQFQHLMLLTPPRTDW